MKYGLTHQVFLLCLLMAASPTTLLSQDNTADSIFQALTDEVPYDDDFDDDEAYYPEPVSDLADKPLSEGATPPQTQSPFPPEKLQAIQSEMNFNPKADWEQKEKEKARKREEAAKKEQEKSESWWAKWNTNRNVGSLEIPNWLFSLLIALFVAACGYVIYKILDSKYLGEAGNKAEKDEGRVAIEEIQEERITFRETESLLERAVRHEQYELAIRLQFLSLLKRLHELGLIVYKKDKVNRAYLYEMDSHASGREFRQITHDFERNWYGNYPTDRLSYRLVAKRFEQMQQQLDELERKTHV